MMSEEKKKRVTSSQRKYLRSLGFEPISGMSSEDASRIISALNAGEDVPEGRWIGEAATEPQIEFMRSLGISIPEGCLKGQACWLLERRQRQ